MCPQGNGTPAAMHAAVAKPLDSTQISQDRENATPYHTSYHPSQCVLFRFVLGEENVAILLRLAKLRPIPKKVQSLKGM